MQQYFSYIVVVSLIRGGNPSTRRKRQTSWAHEIHTRFLVGYVLLILLVFCVVFSVFCLRPVSSVPSVVIFSGLSIFDCHIRFLKHFLSPRWNLEAYSLNATEVTIWQFTFSNNTFSFVFFLLHKRAGQFRKGNIM